MEAIIAAIIAGVFLLSSKFLQDYLERKRQSDTNNESNKFTNEDVKPIKKIISENRKNRSIQVKEKDKKKNPEKSGRVMTSFYIISLSISILSTFLLFADTLNREPMHKEITYIKYLLPMYLITLILYFIQK